MNNYNSTSPDYNQECKDFTRYIKELALTLSQNVEGSIVGDDPFNYYVPPENHGEAKRRIQFTYDMIRQYSKFLHSRQPLGNFVAMLNRKILKLEDQCKQLERQVAFDFMGTIDIEKREKEVKCLVEMRSICRNPVAYFDEPHHIVKRVMF